MFNPSLTLVGPQLVFRCLAFIRRILVKTSPFCSNAVGPELIKHHILMIVVELITSLALPSDFNRVRKEPQVKHLLTKFSSAYAPSFPGLFSVESLSISGLQTILAAQH